MADQEFLASYGVDIDEEGVKRLETILKQNEQMGNSVSAAFNAANQSVEEFINNQPEVGSSGSRDYEALKAQAHEENTFDPVESIQGLAQSLLMGTMADWKDPDDPTNKPNARDWALQNLETMSVGQATRDSANARKELVSWQDYGLESDPTKIQGFSDLQKQAEELLREPIAKAREYMQQAMDAESEGLDGTEYVDKITELLSEPFEKVRQLYDSFDFGDLGEGSDGEGTGGVIDELNTAKQGLTELRSEAQTPVVIRGNASHVVSAARSAIEDVRSLFSETFVLNVRANTEKADSKGDEDEDNERKGSAFRRSVGGRFSNPTYVEVAEDGDEEYIIPIRKENRALPLIRQMMNELSPDARQSIFDNKEVKNTDLPAIGDETAATEQNFIGNGIAAVKQSFVGNAGSMGIGSTIRESQTNETKNVSAPVTINVNASGSDAKRIGQSVYNTAERYLLRTMKGALA